MTNSQLARHEAFNDEENPLVYVIREQTCFCLFVFLFAPSASFTFSQSCSVLDMPTTHTRIQDLPVLPEKVPHAVSRRDSVRVWTSPRHVERWSLFEAAQGAPVRVRRTARHRVHSSADVCDAQRLWFGRALPRVRAVRCLGDCHVNLLAAADSRHSRALCTD